MTSAPALILHDDEATTSLVRGVLTAAGFECRAAPSALRLALADSAEPPRLAVLGLTAIDERDLEIVAILRRRWPDAFLLVTYPWIFRERAAKALAFGADGSLPEPFYPSELGALAARIRSARPLAAHAPLPRSRDEPGGVEQLAAGVAHSIRNPLQIIELELGSAEEAAAEVNVPALRAEVRRIAGVVDGLARFSGQRGIKLRPVDVQALVSHVFGEWKRGKGSATLVVAPPEGGPFTVSGAEDQLVAAFEAVRTRALRVTPHDGAIHVRMRLVDGPPRSVEVSVTDGGPDVGAERLAKIFAPFGDPAAVRDGTGLELAALAGVVRDHGGTVTAETEGAGTTITVRLPAAEGARR